NRGQRMVPLTHDDDGLCSFPEPDFLNETALGMSSWLRRNGRKKFWLADRVARAIERRLRNSVAVLGRDELFRRLDGCASRQLRIEEIQHLGAENGVMAADENEHLAGRDDFLGRTIAVFLRRLQP